MELAEAITKAASEALTFVIAYGNSIDGFQGLTGPFKTYNEAKKYGESHDFRHNKWSVEKIEPPSHE